MHLADQNVAAGTRFRVRAPRSSQSLSARMRVALLVPCVVVVFGGVAQAACGDAKPDGSIRMDDVVITFSSVLGNPGPPNLCGTGQIIDCGDLNASGTVSTADVVLLFRGLLDPITMRGRCVASTRGVPPYKVVGNKIIDNDGNGVEHLFHGVARPSLEWSPTGEFTSFADYQRMHSWGANVVRIALNQSFWLSSSPHYNPNYKATIDQNIIWAESAGMDVILDLHWSDAGNPQTPPGQQLMPDTNSLTFWTQVASRYRTDQRVMFELYNEPHDIDFATWKWGGGPWVGMQTLYNAVRATGATNLVIIGGTEWARRLPTSPQNQISGTNIVYAAHAYQPIQWETSFGFMTATAPVIVTEFGAGGCNPTYYTSLMNYLDTKKISWVAWAWFVGGCEFPSLIVNWQGTPNAPGQVVKNRLLSY